MNEPKRSPLSIVTPPQPEPSPTCANCAEVERDLRAVKRERGQLRTQLETVRAEHAAEVAKLTRAIQRESHHIETSTRSVNDGKRHVRLRGEE